MKQNVLFLQNLILLACKFKALTREKIIYNNINQRTLTYFIRGSNPTQLGFSLTCCHLYLDSKAAESEPVKLETSLTGKLQHMVSVLSST